MSKPKVIAFYLPQYHPTPDNDKWWGKGFTEWTNVGKAKPLFRGHYQPKVPADLGYYDLRLPEVREAQAELAKEAGIYGFCYYHYWFAGKEELELPFNEVLRLGKPDFPFMLCWANESWHQKFWDKDGKGSSKELLIEQTYPGEEDHIAHFYRLLPAFKDPRYIQIDGKPVFMIYKPRLIPNVTELINLWNKLAKENSLKGLTFIAHCLTDEKDFINEEEEITLMIDKGFSFININRIFNPVLKRTKLKKYLNKFSRLITRKPLVVSYKRAIKEFTNYNVDSLEYVIPTIIPNWDHTPRSGINGLVYKDSSPFYFKKHLISVISNIKEKDKNHNFVFLKSWNEWGEGNYIEPDLEFGKDYIISLRNILETYE